MKTEELNVSNNELNKRLDSDLLKSFLDYDQDAGLFKWKVSRRLGLAGKTAGSNASNGYINIRVDGNRYKAHRLAWLYVYGEWPNGEIDHINHVRDDNRIINLRVVSCTENQRNKLINSRNKTGITGVHWDRLISKWVSKISINKKTHQLGYFRDFFEACCARKSAEINFDFHPNHGEKTNAYYNN